MSAATVQIPSERIDSRAMPASRVLLAYFTEAKYETIRMLRAPAFAIPFLCLPVSLYLLFAVVIFGAAIGSDPKSGMFVFIGFDIFGVMGPGIFGFGVVVAMEREQGLLALKRALPMPQPAYLVSKLLMAMLFCTIVTASMITAALTLGHLHLSIGQCFTLAGVNILGSLPFCAIGLFIGARVSGKAAPAIGNIIYLAMIYLSGIMFPMPKSMAASAVIWPAYHLAQLAFRALGQQSQGSALVHVAVLAGVTLAAAGLSVRRLARVG